MLIFVVVSFCYIQILHETLNPNSYGLFNVCETYGEEQNYRQSKIFENDAKKAKTYTKARSSQELSKTKRTNLLRSLFLMMSALFRQ